MNNKKISNLYIGVSIMSLSFACFTLCKLCEQQNLVQGALLMGQMAIAGSSIGSAVKYRKKIKD